MAPKYGMSKRDQSMGRDAIQSFPLRHCHIKSGRISVGDGSVSPYGSNTLTGYGNIPRYRLLIGTPPDDNSRLLARIIGELYSGLGSLKARACVNHVSPMTCSGFQPCLLEASAHCTQLTIDTYLDIQAEPHAKIYV